MPKDTCKFSLEQIVYFKLDPDIRVMITGILFRPNGVSYFGTSSENRDESEFQECELTAEREFAEKA